MTNLSWKFTNWILALLVVVGTLVTNIARADGDAEKIKLIEAEAAGWTRNMDQLLAIFTDDLVYEDNPLARTFHGKEELRAFAQSFFNAFPDLKSVITSAIVSGDRGAAEWRLTGTHFGDLPGMPASNKQMDLHGMSIYYFEGNKIKRTVDYWDLSTMLKQLGFMPTK